MQTFHRCASALFVALLSLTLTGCWVGAAPTPPSWLFTPGTQGTLLAPFSAGSLILAPFVDAAATPPVTRLYAIDSLNGATRWSATLDQNPSGGDGLAPAFHVEAQQLIYQGAQALHALDAATGQERWQRAGVLVLLDVREGRVALLDSEDRLVLLDAASGRQLATTALGLAAPYSYTLDGTTLYASDAGTLVALDLRDGRQRWSRRAPEVQPPDLVCENLAIVRDAQGTHGLDRASGVERWSLPLLVGVDACKDSRIYDQVFDGIREVVRVYDLQKNGAVQTISLVAMNAALGIAPPTPDPGGVVTASGVRVRVEETEREPTPFWDRLTGKAEGKVLESQLDASSATGNIQHWASARLRARLSSPLLVGDLVVVAANPSGVQGQPQILAYPVDSPPSS